jgi:hypothetical protein
VEWDEGFAGPVVQVRAPEPDAEVYLHTCEDGHSWQEKANGTVSPSYGLGGTEYSWPGYDPATCPEPEQLIDPGWAPRIQCPECGKKGMPHELLAGLSCSPWELFEEEKRTGHVHTPPLPVCRKPPVSTLRWMRIKTTVYKESKGGFKKVPGWTGGWVPLDAIAALEGKPSPEPGQLSIFDDETRAKAKAMLAAQDG